MSNKNYLDDEFNGFLKELIEAKRLEPTEEGITKLVIDKGYESLSEKQKFVFDKAIGEFTYDDCQRCGLEIPWSEMYNTEDNGGLCSWCQQVGNKDE